MAGTVIRHEECIAGSEAAPLTGERTVPVDGRRWLGVPISCVPVGMLYLGQRVLGEDRRWKSLCLGREGKAKQDMLFTSC